MVDLKFMDFPGRWQHFSIPIAAFDESTFEEAVGFDSSSPRGGQAIHASDMSGRAGSRHRRPGPLHRGAKKVEIRVEV